MQNVPQIFNFGKQQFRTIEVNGDPWFVARDVAVILGYAKPENAVKAHCKATLKRGIPSASGLQETTIIPERDVYRLVMRSKLPAAVKFEEMVVGEVLPSIRKTGSYGVDPMSALNDPATMRHLLLGYTEKVMALEVKVSTLTPKAAALDRLCDSTNMFGVRAAAAALKMPERKFTFWLEENNWMYRDHRGRLRGYASKMPRYIFHKVTATPIDGDADHISLHAMITMDGLTKLAVMLGVELMPASAVAVELAA